MTHRDKSWDNILLTLTSDSLRMDVWGQVVWHCSCSVTKSLSNTLWPHGLQHTRLPHPPLSPRVCSNSYLLSQWCHPTISLSIAPSPPAFSLFQHQGLFQWVGSLHQMAKVLELQHQCFQWIFRVDSFRMYDITCLVDKSCQTCCDPIDCSLPGSSVLGISQARILEWIAISFSIWHYLLR